MTVYSNTFDSASTGTIPTPFATSSASAWSVTANASTYSLPNDIAESAGATNDLIWYNGPCVVAVSCGVDQVEEEVAFLSQTTSAAGIALITYAKTGAFISLNLQSGNASYFAPGSTSGVTITGQSGFLSTYTIGTPYCAKLLYIAAASTLQSKVWQCGASEPAYGATISTSAYTFASFTAGLRNNYGATSDFDNYAIAFGGAALPPILASPPPTPSPSPSASATPLALATYQPFPLGTMQTGSTSWYQTIASLPSPSPDPSSSAWIADQPTTFFSHLNIQLTSSVATDYNYPCYIATSQDTPVTLSTHASYSTAPTTLNGSTIYLPAGALPEPAADGHFCLIDYLGTFGLAGVAAGTPVEIDLYGASSKSSGTTMPITGSNTAGSTINPGNAGFCILGGYLGQGTYPSATNFMCTTTAVNQPLSLGLFMVSDLQNGPIPHALSGEDACNSHTSIAPAFNSSGDGNCTGGPPEGSRVCINYTSAQVDATTNPTWAKNFWKTLACNYGGVGAAGYGAVIEDTSGSDTRVNTKSGLSYSSIGYTNPDVAFYNNILGGASCSYCTVSNNEVTINVPNAGLSSINGGASINDPSNIIYITSINRP